MTGPQPLPKRVLHRLRSSASSFNFQYPLFSLGSSRSCLRLLQRLSATALLTSVFPSITCSSRQFLHTMCPTQLTFLTFIVCRTFLSFWTTYRICSTIHYLTLSVKLIFSVFLQHHISKLPRYI
jgi:hypothetical protein